MLLGKKLKCQANPFVRIRVQIAAHAGDTVLRVHLCRDKKAGGREQRTARSIGLVLFAGSLLGSLWKEIFPR